MCECLFFRNPDYTGTEALPPAYAGSNIWNLRLCGEPLFFNVMEIFLIDWHRFLFPCLAAFFLSFICSLGGLSGAVLLLPLQVMYFGLSGPSASATNMLFNVVATPLGIIRHIRKKRMLWPLTKILFFSGIPGIIIGSFIRVTLLPDDGIFRYFAGILILYIAVRLLMSTRTKEEPCENRACLFPEDVRTDGGFVRYAFNGRQYCFSIKKIFLLSLAVGIVSGVYGMGGGAVLSPILTGIYGLPVLTVSASSLAANFANCIVGLIMFALYPLLGISGEISPDWAAGFVMGLGGMAGIYLGALVQPYVPERFVKYMLFALMCYIALSFMS